MSPGPKVSVVVPVFNSGPFLRRSLESVLSQSLADFELICVNDGSTDDSSLILDEAVKKDPRVRVVSQENSGGGPARNAGIAQASGTWLYFLDSDDWIRPHTLSTLVEVGESSSSDVVYFDLLRKRKRDRAPQIWWRRRRLARRTWEGHDFLLPALRARAFRPSPCTQFLRRCFLEGSQMRFPDQRISHDVVFSLRVVLAAKRVRYLPAPLYYRNLRPGSITTGSNPLEIVRSTLVNIHTIRVIQQGHLGNRELDLAIDLYVAKQWKYCLNTLRRLPIPARQAIRAENLLETESELSEELLTRARQEGIISAA